jgi:hypothetical protein
MGEGEQPHARGWQGVTRRKALTVFGGAAAGAAVIPRLALPPPASGPRGTGPRLALSGSPSLAFQVIRVADMLYLGFQFYNAKGVVKDGQTYIVPTDPAQPCYMVVIFPSQHLGEEVFVNYNGDANSYPDPPLHGALAGFSWLTFILPPNAQIPFTTAALLDWTGKVATAYDAPHLPDPQHSALEVPWSLWLAPPVKGSWHHSVTPVTSGGRTELWHTRLGLGALEPPYVTPLIKAFWSLGYDAVFAPPPPDPWQMWPGPPGPAQGPVVRKAIVDLSLSVAPVQVSLLALSALGASVSLRGDWPPGEEASLAEWVHRASIGRDSYVRVVYYGYLFPFGNRAVWVVITDREFQTDRAGATVALLVQRSYVVVTEPVITFTGDPNEPSAGRGNPMRTVEVKTVTTPPLEQDAEATINNVSLADAFWVRDNGADVLFSFVVTDIEGRTVDFTTPVIWVIQGVADGTIPGALGNVKSAYDGAGASRNSPSFGGNLFAFADPGSTPGSTAHYVDTYTLTGTPATNGAANFYPQLSQTSGAMLHLPGAEQLTGVTLNIPPSLIFYEKYLNNAFAGAYTDVYLQVLNNAPNLAFPVQLVGGMAAPNFGLTGITRDLGPVGGDLDSLFGGTFDPSSFFSVLSGSIGKLLGAIDITGIISKFTSADPAAKAQAPQISSNWIYPGSPPDDNQAPIALDTKLQWNPEVTHDSSFFFNPAPDPGANLLITAEIYTPISEPTQTTYTIHGELTNFTLKLFGSANDFIDITFTSFTFDTKTGAKPSIKPQISAVTFNPANALGFISEFEQLLGSLGGPSIDVTGAGINASYSLALPSVGLGVFSLSNLSLSAGVNIPFDSTPVRVRFALCSQDNPFQLSIYVFGGGGFFSLAIGADGIELIQVSLEFGASISIDLGVASGGVSIMAGIYFSLQTVPSEQVVLTGFLRADGNLSVLGIVTLSMEFYLGLTYQQPGQAYGEASVTVSISVLFFSTSVTATYQKTISGGDPVFDFAQAISNADWDVYCEAFA